jgi:hypothetical protein
VLKEPTESLKVVVGDGPRGGDRAEHWHEAVSIDLRELGGKFVAGRGGQVFADVWPLVRGIGVGDQFGTSPKPLPSRREVQTMIVAVDRPVIVEVIKPLLVVAEAPVTEGIYPDMATCIVIS